VKVTVTRRGGFAGIALRGSADTAECPGSEEALRARLGTTPGPPQPDAFTYEVTFGNQTVSLGERDVDDQVRPLIDAALANGEIL
jgi:hypothetical protein